MMILKETVTTLTLKICPMFGEDLQSANMNFSWCGLCSTALIFYEAVLAQSCDQTYHSEVRK